MNKNTRLALIVTACIAAVAILLCLTGTAGRTAYPYNDGTVLHFSVGEKFDLDKVSSALSAAGAEGAVVRTVPAEMPEEEAPAEETAEPASEEAPAADAEPAADEAPAADAEPAADDAPAADAEPVTDEAAAADAEPASDEAEKTETPAVRKETGDRLTDFEVTLTRVLSDEEIASCAEKTVQALSSDYDSVKFLYGGTLHAAYGAGKLITGALTALAALFVIAGLYIAVRFDLASLGAFAASFVLCAVLACALSMLAAIALPFTESAEAAAAFTGVASCLATFALFDRIRSFTKISEYSRMDRAGLANAAAAAVKKPFLTFLAFALVAAVCTFFTGRASLSSAAVFSLIGCIAACAVCLTVTGPVWAALADRKRTRSTRKA